MKEQAYNKEQRERPRPHELNDKSNLIDLMKEDPTQEVVFTKADESLFVPTPEIPSDLESDGEPQEPLPPLPKLMELTLLEPLTNKKSDKVSTAYVIKKKTENKPPAEPKSCSDKKADWYVTDIHKKTKTRQNRTKPSTRLERAWKTKAEGICISDSSTEQLLLTLMGEVKGLKDYIKIPPGTSPSDS
ncbi:hypothetical protein Tco_0979073 [Tanacetum coccineum]